MLNAPCFSKNHFPSFVNCMSFKTNPILSRLKIQKGWKQSTFPRKSSNYSRDITFMFKVYLLLTAYLALNNFRLLMCQVRNSITFSKTIYIVIVYSKSDNKTKKRMSKSRFLSFSSLQYLPQDKTAIYLMYNKLALLQQFTAYSHYIMRRKNPSRFWWKTIKANNELLYIIYMRKLTNQINRQTKNSKVKLRYTRTHIYTNRMRMSSFYKRAHLWTSLRSKLLFKLSCLEREFFFLTKNIKIINYSIQKVQGIQLITNQYLSFLFFLKQKLKGNIFSLKKTLAILFWLRNLYLFRQKKYQRYKRRISSKHWNIYFHRVNQTHKFKIRTRPLIKQLMAFRTKHKKSCFSLFCRVIENQFNSFRKTHKYRQLIFCDRKVIFSLLQTYFYMIKINNIFKFESIERTVQWNQLERKYVFLTKLFNFFLYHDSNFSKLTTFNFKNSRFLDQFYNLPLNQFITSQQRKKNRRLSTFIFNLKYVRNVRKLWKTNIEDFRVKDSLFVPSKLTLLKTLRWKKHVLLQQKTRRITKKGRRIKSLIFSFRSQRCFSQKTSSLFLNLRNSQLKRKNKTKSQTHSTQNSLQYRVTYWKENKNHSLLLNKYKLKSLLQNFLKIYLHTTFQIKIVNSVVDFKNIKFYRLFFPKPKWQKLPENPLKKRKPQISAYSKQRDYFLVSKIQPKLKPGRYIYIGSKKNRTLNSKLLETQKPTNFLFRAINKSASTRKIVSNLYWNQSLLLQRKKKTLGYKNHAIFSNILPWNKKKPFEVVSNIRYHEVKFMKRILPILAIFTRYLNVQLLVNYIAYELESARKHWFILSNLKTILSLFPFHRLIAYKISIFGRINSAKKARMIYLKKGSFSIQTLNRRVNFGMAQSRARIGTFSVKMWIYY